MAALTESSEVIKALNDWLRHQGVGGRVLVTSGLHALGPETLRQILQAVAAFDAFTPDNDPYGEHDFGAVEHAGQTIYFKIDYYDANLQHHSIDPADPAATRRVMTLMLADEY